MFGVFDEVVDTATSIVGTAVEVATFGTVKSDTAKSLARTGLTVAEIAIEMDVTVEVVKRLLK